MIRPTLKRRALPKGLKAVYVRWLDSATHRGWEQPDVGEPTVCHSVGIEVGRTEDSITLSTSFNGGSLYVDQIVIPMVAVQAIRPLSKRGSKE